ncbi:MAG: polysaccharide deacetylase [Nitrobacter vulgaris]|nr:polysaccharide deacetylase [Nitrobacter vulgaris]
MSILRVTLLVFVAWTTSAWASDCPRQGTLGTSRILGVDAAKYPRVGLKSFPQTLPLDDKEVVLTFDDGPAATTPRILAALARQCVRATFFQVGRSSQALPGVVKNAATGGHTLGHHSWSHPHLNAMTFAAARDNIDRGISADEAALNGKATSVPDTRFFRFPYFESTPELLEMLQARGIVVFGADFWASDWRPMTPEEELKLITSADGRAERHHPVSRYPRANRCHAARFSEIHARQWLPRGACGSEAERPKNVNADGCLETC